MCVLIAENQSKVRFALRVTLERQPGLSSVSEVVDADELISQANAMHPDLVLLDWDLPEMDAGQTLPTLRKVCPHLFVIALGAKDESREKARAQGADAFVSKADPPERLLAAIGEYWKRQVDQA